MPVEVTPIKTISWPKVILTVVIITVVVGLIGGGLYWYYYIRQPETSTSVTITKQSTSSAKPATPSAQKDETAGWKTYRNTNYGYEIKYPKEMKLKISEDDSALTSNLFGPNGIHAARFYLVNQPEGWAELTEGVAVHLGVIKNPSQLSPKQLADNAETGYEETYPGIKVDIGEVTVGSIKGYKVVTDPTQTQGNDIFLPLNDRTKAIDMFFIFRGSKSVEYQNLFDLMVSTFRFD
jgi:hypothetical protein